MGDGHAPFVPRHRRTRTPPGTSDRVVGGVRDRNTPRTDGGGGGGVRAIVTHHKPMTGGPTYDRRGCLKKEDKYASGQGIEKADSPA